jgi:hypothetical protein
MPKTRSLPRKPRVDPVAVALERLAEAQEETQGELRALAEAQRRTEERLSALTQRVEQLAEAIFALTGEVRILKDQVGELRGDAVERQYRDRAPAYFDDILRRLRVLSPSDLASLIDDAADQGHISRDERRDLLLAGVVARGRRADTGEDAYLVVEVSATVKGADVERAARRAQVLTRATGTGTVAAVAGQEVALDAERAAKDLAVWRVTNGRATGPTK